MQVIKRDGRSEIVKFDKIAKRVRIAAKGLKHVDYAEVAQKVVAGLFDGVTSKQLDTLAYETAYAMATKHPDYDKLATRLIVSNLHKGTPSTFVEAISQLCSITDSFGNNKSIINEDLKKFVKKNGHILDANINYDRDYNFDYFGFKTLERSYLLKGFEKNPEGKFVQNIIERPQHLFMRVAASIHSDDISACLNTYEMLSTNKMIHATPTLFNSGLIKNQLSSCFIAGTQVFTTNRGNVNIEDIEIGDLVITHGGEVKPVEQVHTNDLNNRKLFDVKAFGSPQITVTGNHKFLSITAEQQGWGHDPQWNPIDTLRVGDYISTGNLLKNDYKEHSFNLIDYVPAGDGNVKYEKSIIDGILQVKSVWERTHMLKNFDKVNVTRNHNTIANTITCDDQFAYFLGIWFGDGCLLKRKNSLGERNIYSTVGVSIHNDNVELINWLKSYTTNTLKCDYQHTLTEGYNFANFNISSVALASFMFKEFKTGFDKKDITSMLDKFDYNQVISFMEGLITSDGCVTKDGDIRISLCNDKLVKNIFSMCRSYGITLSYSSCFAKYFGENKLVSRISFPKGVISLNEIRKTYTDGRLIVTECINKSAHVKVIDGKSFVRIAAKTISDVSAKNVYTLGVKDHHSYMVEGVMAENCFLIANKEDSIDGIFATLTEMAKISQSAGGIGVHIHDVRAKGSPIYGTGGTSNGIIPMLRVFNETCRYVDQGGNKRKGSAAIYLSPENAGVMDFLNLRKNNGAESERCRDLNLAIWAPDLFFERVEADADWTLMDPGKCPGLADCYGKEFVTLYEQYESEGKGEKVVKAREIWAKIIESQIETGQPYILAKDTCNEKSNQKNLGTIKSSNLCAEIIEYSDPEYTACCNLASVSLPACLLEDKGVYTFDFEKLFNITKTLTENLNKIIDIGFYPVEAAKKSNFRDRPIAIGIQGLADVFALMRYSWDSEAALELNNQIAETMYFSFLDTSCNLAKKDGTYGSYKGSPISKGILHPDTYNITPSNLWNWKKLRNKIVKHGVRNSLGIALMPTASSSNIMGNTECFEMKTSNLYKRSTLSGEFIQLNKYLVADLIKLDLWSDDMRQRIMLEQGSVQNIPEIPVELKELYKTVWETSQKVIIDMAAGRAPYVDQSQSMNLYIKNPNSAKISSALMYGWKKGLKTLVYYLRGNSKVEAKQFTLDQSLKEKSSAEISEFEEGVACSLDDPDCESCSG